MKTNKFFAKKKPGQAMVEFALALPVLLLLLYGILEAGRFLFLYSTVVTASRQAARYGTTTGDGGGATPVYGAPRSVVPRYDDCAGIRGAGNAVAYITRGGFNIQLSWDQGPNDPDPTHPVPICTSGAPDEVSSSPNIRDIGHNTTRLVVTVSTEFVPIVPKLVPFIRRTITATSARTILYSVAIQVPQEQQGDWTKNPTTLEIISVDPEPSEPGALVNVTVKVTGGDPVPTGNVQISGADLNCPDQDLPDTGIVSCQIRFDTAGLKAITAIYSGDADNQASSAVADHLVEVLVYPTVIQITLDQPDPSVKGQQFVVAVKVTGGGNTPTGTVDVSGGGGVTCSIPLTTSSMGLGSCALSFNNTNPQFKTLTATYSGDATHLSSTVTEPHEVIDGTPTPTLSPTATLIPSDTPTPTATSIPTAIPTAVASCNSITAPGGITIAGNVMSITINNPYAFDLAMDVLLVTWNDDKGHTVGSDKTLKLQTVTVGQTTIFQGLTSNISTQTINRPSAKVPQGNTIISFTFNQTYDNRDGTENVLINWLTPGCENNPISVK